MFAANLQVRRHTTTLYRALRQEEIVRGLIIPKTRGPFVADPMLPNVLPFTLGKCPEYAVRAHQWNGQYLTSGISTTPHFHRAEHYAQRDRVIVRIAVEHLIAWGIQTFRVSEHVHPSLIFAPEDDEVILFCPGADVFPREIIAEIFDLDKVVT